MQWTQDSSCTHRPLRAGTVEVVACPTCGAVEWFGKGRRLTPDEGMAAAFGSFDLVGEVPAVSAPSDRVLVYRAPAGSGRRHLAAFASHVWWRVTPDLWMCHDDAALLLAPTDPMLARNLTRER
ncbi:MAG: hypothetical protein R6X29_06565 [Acidimicrobiia bacterium]|jgi:hypothetical protein